MPETIKAWNATCGGIKDWMATWAPVADPREPGVETLDDLHCLYCDCPMSEHQTVAMMFAPKGKRRRIRTGLSVAKCLTCAKEMDTVQVVCYLAPGMSAD